ncbi:hypothetical protein [Curtobacterium sp. MCSS17_007]|uniref:hypothetical protein n=1 Tax=Curtobacterium sp. MCSS17_007 TaxID=2175646 RepID=UPI0024DFCB78|nr:hypothetical protein [Curtobacterium sp. MCSS17_007]WIE77105.1 hypothetical protein DEJ22_007590 [Curtobacterium sp. MCSS17_007]
MADDDVTAGRARLEALAWGGQSTPEEAARARVALREMDRPGSGGASGGTAVTPGPPPDATGRPTGTGTTPEERRPDGDGPERAGLPSDGAEPAGRPGDGPDDARPDSDGARGPGAVRTGGGSGLPAASSTWRSRVGGLLWTARPRAWIALGTAAVVALAFAAGTLVGTSHEERVAAPRTTPTPGTVTLEELLDVPQTYADQLPGPVEAPVSLRTTRLVFTNRALDGTSFETPWNVWAGVGTDRETICLVATANRLESTTACYPRTDALHGNVSLSAQSMSGTLTITLRGGGVQGTVTNEN